MNRERKETANKGFSLVELIIVVAIMAVLIGVLAPQYTKYVEKSRVSADKQSVDAIVSALQIYYVDTDVAAANQIKTGAKITITTTDTTVSATNATNNADKALSSAGISNIGLKSSSWGSNAGKIELTVTITNGALSVTSSDASIFS